MDDLRRWANLVLALGQIVTTVLCFSLGVSFENATGETAADPPIVPAGYAFIVWSVIYAGCVAYGIYQFAKPRSQDPLLRSIGFFTASAFLGTCCWLLAARFGKLYLTIVCIVWMGVWLFTAFRKLWQKVAFSVGERWCVLVPISIFSGWVSVAIFANTASVVGISGRPWLTEVGWSLLLICTASAFVLYILLRTHGNAWYGGTVIWALVGIAVRNHFQLENPSVAYTALTAAAVLLLVILRGHGSVYGGGVSAAMPSSGAQ